MFRSIFGVAPIWRNGVPIASLCPGGNLLFLMFEPFNSGVVIASDIANLLHLSLIVLKGHVEEWFVESLL